MFNLLMKCFALAFLLLECETAGELIKMNGDNLRALLLAMMEMHDLNGCY